MWHLMCHFLRDTQASLSAPWQDSGSPKGVLSSLLFNLLIDTLASDVRQLAPGVRPIIISPTSCTLMTLWWWWIASTICRCLATLWQRGPRTTKSAAMVFGPTGLVPICAATLAGVPLPQVSECPHLSVTLTSTLTWVPHIRKLIARGNHLIAQCAWCCSEHLPLVFASKLFHTCMLPNVLWGAEFCSGSVPAVRLLLNTA